MMKKTIILNFILMISLPVMAQDWNLSNFYNQNKFIMNPAQAGSSESPTAFMTTRKQWIGLPGSPLILQAGITVPIDSSSKGIGINIIHTNGLLINQNIGELSFSKKLKINSVSSMGMGVSGGIYSQSLSTSNVITQDYTDPFLQGELYNETRLRIGAGLFYQYKKAELNISAPDLLNDDGRLSAFLIHVNYSIALTNPAWELKPSFLVHSIPKVGSFTDLALMATYDKMFWAQIGYRVNNSILTSAGVNYRKLVFGYSFSTEVGALNSLNGGHEIYLSYSLAKK